ncbi:MAG: MFS transporter [Rhodocyclaceae bacterium]|nr:MFS transporter [Rhodocyclaceae bacterium]
MRWMPRRTPALVVLCGCLVLTFSMGTRQTFGLFVKPIAIDLQLGREVFAFAIALQNLVWGLGQPFAGLIADRFGAARVIAIAAMTYVAGLVTLHHATGPLGMDLAGALIGLGLSGTGSGLIIGVVARNVSEERRSLAFGVVAAGGSFGQFVMVPFGQSLIAGFGWQDALLYLALTVALIVPLARVLVSPAAHTAVGAPGQSPAAAIGEAARHRGYWLLFSGFFVCGFQVMFIGLHLPAYLLDRGLSTVNATTALALIGLFNILGSFLAGYLGGRYSKKRLLSGIYFGRGLLICMFLALPLSPASAYVFAAGMGLLWLGTMPLTNGMVAHMFGVRYLSTLYGGVFLGHQLGSFLGAWLGGYVFDQTGSYQIMWGCTIALAVFAGLINLPIDERPVRRSELATAAT